MTFEKQALETKLRKYVAHCKALENDKAQIVDTLRVRKRAVVDDDFAGAVVSLCDELTSLEKECDSHSTTANRTSSDSAQMEKLREEFSSVKSERNDFQSKVLRLTRSEGELSSKVQRLESKVAVLREERDKLRSHVNGGVSEKSRQVKFLEEENLKLITELKSTKKQLNTARTEIESFKMNGLGVDDTEDFSNFHLNNKPKTATGALPMTPEHKENKPNIFSTSKKKSVSASTKKRRTLGRSAHKQRPVGLGEAAPDDDMNTQECRQS